MSDSIDYEHDALFDVIRPIDDPYGEKNALLAIETPPDENIDGAEAIRALIYAISVKRGTWIERASCRGMSVESGSGLFWDSSSTFDKNGKEKKEPQNEVASRHEEARKICFDCVVREQCLDYALSGPERFHIWGGATKEERKKDPRLSKDRHSSDY